LTDLQTATSVASFSLCAIAGLAYVTTHSEESPPPPAYLSVKDLLLNEAASWLIKTVVGREE